MYAHWCSTLTPRSAPSPLPMGVRAVHSVRVRQHDEWVQRKARHGSDSARHAAFAEWVSATLQLPPGAIVWDVGGGQGHTALELVARGMRVVLIDPMQHAGKALFRANAAGSEPALGIDEADPHGTHGTQGLHGTQGVTVVRDVFDGTFQERHPELVSPTSQSLRLMSVKVQRSWGAAGCAGGATRATPRRGHRRHR